MIFVSVSEYETYPVTNFLSNICMSGLMAVGLVIVTYFELMISNNFFFFFAPA